MTAEASKNFTEEQRSSDITNAALNRPGQPEEVTGLIMFLLGPESSFITGAVHNVDGGWVC